MPKKRKTRKNNTLQLVLTVNGRVKWEGKSVWEVAQKLPWIGKKGATVCFFIEGVEYSLPPIEHWHFQRCVLSDVRRDLVDHIKRCIDLYESFYLEAEKNNDRQLRN